MGRETVAIRVDRQRPTKAAVDATSLLSLPRAANRLYLRETVDVTLSVYDGADAAAFGSTATFRLLVKSAADLAGDIIAQTTTCASTAEQLAAGTVAMTGLQLGTVEAIAALGTSDALPVRIELIEQDAGGARVALVGTWPGVLLATAYAGTESDPIYASPLKHNTAATVAPDADDDSTDGYAVGSVWVDTVTGNGGNARLWWCLDATSGAAVWEELTVVELPFAIEDPGEALHVLLPYAFGDYRLVGLAIKCASGSATGRLYVGDEILSAGIPIGAEFATGSWSSANLVAAGSSIRLETYNDSLCAWLQGSLLLRRGA